MTAPSTTATAVDGTAPATVDARSRWTVADVEDFEAALGIDFANLGAALADEGTTMGGRLRVMAVIVWLERRRDEPGYTLDEARRTPLSELTTTAEATAASLTGADVGAPPDPTEAP